MVQRDVKRMLAYSAIAHAGFMLIGILAYSKAAISALSFYALTYGIATVGAFGIITLVRSHRDGSVGVRTATWMPSRAWDAAAPGRPVP